MGGMISVGPRGSFKRRTQGTRSLLGFFSSCPGSREVLSLEPEVCAWCARNRLFPSNVSKIFVQGISSLLIFIAG